MYGITNGFNPIGIGVAEGAFFAPTLLLAKDAMSHAAHDVEAFGPVSTLMPYDTLDEALWGALRVLEEQAELKDQVATLSLTVPTIRSGSPSRSTSPTTSANVLSLCCGSREVASV